MEEALKDWFVFLSRKGVRAVREIHARRDRRTGASPQEQHAIACRLLLRDDWTCFDDVYLALYVLSLTDTRTFAADDCRGSGLRLDVALDLDVHWQESSERMIDEWAVADIINLRAGLKRLMSVDLSLAFLRLAPFEVSFLVPGFSGGISDKESIVMMRSYLETTNIEAIKERYRVTGFRMGPGLA